MPLKDIHRSKVQRRHQSLLEVLIAFALIALCVLPLIYPHVAIYKAQNKFARKLELDHVVNLLYGKVLEKLYMNTIPWADLAQTTSKRRIVLNTNTMFLWLETYEDLHHD
jgi:hypothetical protein